MCWIYKAWLQRKGFLSPSLPSSVVKEAAFVSGPWGSPHHIWLPLVPSPSILSCRLFPALVIVILRACPCTPEGTRYPDNLPSHCLCSSSLCGRISRQMEHEVLWVFSISHGLQRTRLPCFLEYPEHHQIRKNNMSLFGFLDHNLRGHSVDKAHKFRLASYVPLNDVVQLPYPHFSPFEKQEGMYWTTVNTLEAKNFSLLVTIQGRIMVLITCCFSELLKNVYG